MMEFNDLYEELFRVRSEHESLCEEINESYNPFRGDDPRDPRCRRCDILYAKLEALEERYLQVLDEEHKSDVRANAFAALDNALINDPDIVELSTREIATDLGTYDCDLEGLEVSLLQSLVIEWLERFAFDYNATD